MDCSMESKVDMPAFHMESSGIHVEPMWNSSFHPHSTWNKKLAGVSVNIHSMDSIRNNLGKVKTSPRAS